MPPVVVPLTALLMVLLARAAGGAEIHIRPHRRSWHVLAVAEYPLAVAEVPLAVPPAPLLLPAL